MDTFDYKKYLAEGRLLKETFVKLSDEQRKKVKDAAKRGEAPEDVIDSDFGGDDKYLQSVKALMDKLAEGKLLKEDKGINYLKDAFEIYLEGGDDFNKEVGETETVKFENDESLISKEKFKVALQSLPTTVKVDAYNVNFKKVGNDIIGTFKITEGKLFEKEGVPHYTKDGEEWKGKTHKMPDGSLMSGNPHDKDGSGPNGESEKLFHKEDLNENIISEISDADIIKAVAIAADVSPKELVAKAKESEGENVDEAVLTTVLTAITIAGLIPPALNLLGNITNATSRAFKLTDEEKEDYDRLSREIKDASGDEKVALKKELDEKYGSKVGNFFKNAGTGLHHKYTSPIRKMLNFAGKFAKKGSSLKDKEKNEVRANIIYAVLMAGVAGFGIWTHIGHLKGIAPVAGFIADSVKEGISIADIIEGAFELAKIA